MRLYIIRHADPDYANNTITPSGHLEAQALAKRMAKVKPDRIYVSPMGRARHTAQYTLDALRMTPVVEDWTAELENLQLEHPPWGRLMAWDVPGEVIRRDETPPTCDDWHRADPFDPPTLRAEFERIKTDSDAFLKRHGYERRGARYACVAPHRESLAVFCHNGFAQCWLAHLLHLPLTMVWSGFWLPPSSVTTVLFDERSKEWATPRCIGVGDVGHLYAEGLPVLPRGIKANYE